MNAYEIIDRIINREMKNYISDNELSEMGDIKQIVLAILKTDYSAWRVPSDDNHFCGGWYFKNPNYVLVKGYSLDYCSFDEMEFKNLALGTVEDLEFLADQIARLEIDFYYKAKKNQKLQIKISEEIDKIIKSLSANPHVYIGAHHIWKMTPTTWTEAPKKEVAKIIPLF